MFQHLVFELHFDDAQHSVMRDVCDAPLSSLFGARQIQLIMLS